MTREADAVVEVPLAILERHATLDYPENKGFDHYGDQFGFHFDAIDKLDVTWH